jgi:Tfp pilus assembly PilM family ATPase
MFKRRIRSLIGLDVGTKAVKAVEMTMNGGIVLTGFGYAELPSPDAVRETVASACSRRTSSTRGAS